MGVQLPNEPITRKEQYLAKAAGQAVETPAEPITREEAYLDAIAKGSGGGGGGTTNYNQLSNKPQIAGTTLQGNKSLADLGIASASELENKVDKVDGKDLSSNDYSDTEKQKNADNATAISAIKDGATIDSFADVESALSNKQDTLTFDDVPTTNSNNPVKSGGVKNAIDAAVASAYHHAGTKTCAELVAGLLVAGNEGNVYNMTDSGTTTADFIEGAGQPIKAGDNVGIAKISDGVYKFDLLSGFVDTTNFVQKSETAGLLKNDGTVDTTIQGDVSTLKSGLTTVHDGFKDAIGWDNRNNIAKLYRELYKVDTDGRLNSSSNSNLYIANVLPNTDYTLSFLHYDSSVTTTITCYYCWHDANEQLISVSSYSYKANVDERHNAVITSPNDAVTLYVTFRRSTSNDMVNEGSEMLPYEPYHPVIGTAVEDHESRIEAVESGLDAVKNMLIASSQSTGTTQSKLNELYTAWQSLTDDEKRRAYIFAGENTKYNLTNKYYRIFNNTAYSSSDSALFSRTVELKSSTSTSIVVEIKDTGTTTTDKSLDENSTIWYLYV